MAGRGDRQKLGHSLDDAEDDGGNEQGVEHVVSGCLGRQRLPIAARRSRPGRRLSIMLPQPGPAPRQQSRSGGRRRRIASIGTPTAVANVPTAAPIA